MGGNTVSAKRGRLGTLTVQNLIVVAFNLWLLKQMEPEEEFSDDEFVNSAENDNATEDESDE